jgi:hypothetical protein
MGFGRHEPSLSSRARAGSWVSGARFRRGIEHHNMLGAEMCAREMGILDLAEALGDRPGSSGADYGQQSAILTSTLPSLNIR